MIESVTDYLYEDGTSMDGNIRMQAYYHMYFKFFVDLLKCIGIYDESLQKQYFKSDRFLAIMTNQNGFFPSLGNSDSIKSAYPQLNEGGYFPNGKLAVIKDGDSFLIYRINEKTGQINLHWELGKYGVFLENGKFGTGKIYSSLYSNKKIQDSYLTTKTDENSISISNHNTKAEYSFDSSEYTINIHIDYEKKSDGLRHLFILSSKARDVRINKDSASFFVGGNCVYITTSSQNPIQINLSNCTVNASDSSMVLEVVSSSDSNQIDIKIRADKKAYLAFKEDQADFLPDRAYQQVKNMMTSDIMDQLVRHGNIGATEIYRLGRQAYLEHDMEMSKRCEVLNSILHNCSIKSSCKLGAGTRLAYGGIGVLIHKDSKTGKNCMIGVGASLASAVTLGNYVYVSPGVRFISKFHVGNFCIIGANAVVRRKVEPFSIVAGVPARVIKRITPENVDLYLRDYFAAVDKTNPDFVQSVRQEFLEEYAQYCVDINSAQNKNDA